MTDGRREARPIAVVPMRGGSERVPRKNLLPFAGRPLYHRIVRTLLQVPELAAVVIDSESDEILEDAAREFPEVRLSRRPARLGAGDVSMNEVLVDLLGRVDAEYVLQTHATNPLLRAETISSAIRAFRQSPEHDSLFTVTRLQTRLWWPDGRPVNHDPGVLLRTQDLPPVYEENSCAYLLCGETLKRRGNRIGDRPLLFEIPRLEGVDIDEWPDFVLAESLLTAAQ